MIGCFMHHTAKGEGCVRTGCECPTSSCDLEENEEVDGGLRGLGATSGGRAGLCFLTAGGVMQIERRVTFSRLAVVRGGEEEERRRREERDKREGGD